VSPRSHRSKCFASRITGTANLETTTAKIGATQAALRAAHLKYHLATVAILTPEQVAKYNELRGYKNGERPMQHHQIISNSPWSADEQRTDARRAAPHRASPRKDASGAACGV